MRCSNPFSASVHRRSLPLTALRMHLPSEEDRILNFLGNEHRLNYEKQAYGGVCSVRNFGRPQTVCGLNGFWGSTHSHITRWGAFFSNPTMRAGCGNIASQENLECGSLPAAY
uniref:Uncharacterized protein n=1 Tax=Physcomitrium patens TaxID=3218 RepID=A0A7I4EM47_PHYPA